MTTTEHSLSTPADMSSMKDILMIDRCEKLQHPSYLNLAVSLIILVGLFVSYLPQHYRIVARGTSEGISPYFVLLGTTSATSGFANILILPASRADAACCRDISPFDCFAGLLGIAQVGAQWFCFSIILLLFLVFFPRTSSMSEIASTTPKQPTWRTALGIGSLCIFHGLILVIISAILFTTHPESLGTWANVLGLMAAVLAAVQYFPQIWTTYTLGHVGSLSIPMMCIQTPGGFLFAGSLAARLGSEGWSTWGVYLVTASLQGVLLVMGIYFEVQARHVKQASRENGEFNGTQVPDHLRAGVQETDDEGGPVVENGVQSERTPLLAANK